MGRCRTGCRPRKFSAMSTVAASAIVGFLGNRLIQGLGKCSVVGDSRPPSMFLMSALHRWRRGVCSWGNGWNSCHDGDYSFMIRMAFTGSIGPVSCHLLLSFDAGALSIQPWLHSTIQRFINTTWQKEKAMASGLQPTVSARRRQEQRLPCSSWVGVFMVKTPRPLHGASE